MPVGARGEIHGLEWLSTAPRKKENPIFNNTDKISRQVEMIGESKEGLFMLDRELGTRVYTAGSPFDPAAYNLVQ